MGSLSEIARLKRRIDREIDAMNRGMSGYAVVSRHEVISNRYQRLGDCVEELARHIGTQAAIEALIETLEEKL